MRLFSRDKLKINVVKAKTDSFSGWMKCTKCFEMVHLDELSKNLSCCPKCDFHYRMDVYKRIELLADRDSFVRLFDELTSADPLNFVDSRNYRDRLIEAREQSQESEAIIVGTAEIHGISVALGVMNFAFMAGSMGSVVGERLTRLIELACEENLPVVVVSTSGGARMQESIFSLMQMAKTSCALSKLHKKGLAFVSILTDPTSGGVTASFASLGDVILAEPDALICFAGPRVVEQVMREKLPEGAQRSEFLLKHGMIDAIVQRSEMKKQLSLVLHYLTCKRKKVVESNQFYRELLV